MTSRERHVRATGGSNTSGWGARQAITTAIDMRPSVDLDDYGARLAAKLDGYRIAEPLGVGGMGAVYRAEDKKFGRDVAVKVLLPPTDASHAVAWRRRFEREAVTMARLQHPHILTVYDFGQDEELAWIVLEYVDGANLRDLLRDGALGQDEAFDVAAQLGSALQYAHERGIIHRDVKPENVLVTDRGHVKVADFGIAKVDDPNFETLTQSDQALGSRAYVAPEVLRSGALVDNRADVYAFGAVVYEMLTGTQSMGNFALPSSTDGVDPDLDEPILRALDPDPNTRTASVGETVRAIRALRDARAAGQPNLRDSALRAVANELHVRQSWLVVGTCALGIGSLGLVWFRVSGEYTGWQSGTGTITAFAFALPILIRVVLGPHPMRRLLGAVDGACGAVCLTYALMPLWHFELLESTAERVDTLGPGAWVAAMCGALLVVQAIIALAIKAPGTGDRRRTQETEEVATLRRIRESRDSR